MQNFVDKTVDNKEQTVNRIKNSQPIFIIGSHRSGTSFLYRLIQRHLKIGFGRDNGHFIRMHKMLPYYGDLANEENLRRLLQDIIRIPDFKKRFAGLEIDIDRFIKQMDERTYTEVMRRFYAEWAHFRNTIRWGGKTPDYSLYAPQLYSFFPDGKFIHIIRDGRDVALSLHKLDWGPKDALIAAQHWKERVSAALEFGRSLDSKSYMELRYENLVQHPEEEFRRLIGFIEYEGDHEAIIKEFISQTAPSVKRDNFFKWKRELSGSQVRAFERLAGDLLGELDYDIVYPNTAGGSVAGWRKTWHYARNFAIKLSKGQGIKGTLIKFRQLLSEAWIKIRSK